MNYNESYSRKNTNCLKWDNNEQVFSIENADHLLPMWIADMDIATPSFIIDAMKERLNHPIFGYTKVSDSLLDAIVSWFSTRHNWTINKQHLLLHDGVIPAIATIIETFSEVNDQVCISSPVYGPFDSIPRNLKREVVHVPLHELNGRYSYDFAPLEQAFANGVKIYILCNPHNPGGIVWNKETLQTILQLAKRYNVLIISDEIHCDLVLDSNKHVALQTLNDDIGASIVTCLAPTKTFNLASVHFAMMVASNKELTTKLQQHALMHGRFGPNAFAIVATEAAYTQGANWVDGLLEHISSNMEYVIDSCKQIPGLSIVKPQGTYLLWLDCRTMNISEKEIQNKLLTNGLGLDPGSKFGEQGNGFLRMNVAAPHATVQEAINRLKQALL